MVMLKLVLCTRPMYNFPFSCPGLEFLCVILSLSLACLTVVSHLEQRGGVS